MDRTATLKEMMTAYWQLDPDALNASVAFDSTLPRYTSLRMLRFLAAVEERLQVTIPDPDAIKTFGDLAAAVVESR